jgi:hypothetical protein
VIWNSYLSYGTLVFALELDSEEKIVKQYNLPAFRDLYYSPKNNIPNELLFEDPIIDLNFNEC